MAALQASSKLNEERLNEEEFSKVRSAVHGPGPNLESKG
jgi:hypothetical protein